MMGNNNYFSKNDDDESEKIIFQRLYMSHMYCRLCGLKSAQITTMHCLA